MESNQFLDMIAENVQLKEEIQALRQYNKSIRKFDKTIVKITFDGLINDQIDLSGFDSTVESIKSGIKPIESAESIKKRLVNDRLTKSNNHIRDNIENLSKKRNIAREKHEKLINDTEILAKSIEEHKQTISEAQAIKQRLESENQTLDKSIEDLKIQVKIHNNSLELEQTTCVQIRRSMEQSYRLLNTFCLSDPDNTNKVETLKKKIENLRSNLNESYC